MHSKKITESRRDFEISIHLISTIRASIPPKANNRSGEKLKPNTKYGKNATNFQNDFQVKRPPGEAQRDVLKSAFLTDLHFINNPRTIVRIKEVLPLS